MAMARAAAFMSLVCVVGWGAASAPAETYSDPTLVNLFRRVDAAGNFAVQTEWVDLTSGTYMQYGPYNGVDAGSWNSQLNFGSQSASNFAAYQITLPEAVHIDTIKHAYGGHRAQQYRILGSTTGFGSMTELVGWTAVTGNNPTPDTVDATVQYIRVEFQGTATSQYLLLQEIEAYAPAGAVIDVTDGYNLFAQRSAAGPITMTGGSWADPIGRVINLNEADYVRGNQNGIDSWFIVPLNDSYELTGAAVGFYHGQSYGNGMTIEVTNDAVIDGTETWTTVFDQRTRVYAQTIPFAGTFEARYVKVTNWGGVWDALCEFEVYAYKPEQTVAIPEPASALLVLAGAAVLARRRRRA